MSLYIELHQQLRESPKLKRAALGLGCSRAQAIGHLCLLWLWCVDNAPDGDLSGYEEDVIAEAAEWEGPPETFITALINARVKRSGHGFLERDDQNGLRVHDWHEWAGALIAWRRRRAERQRRLRSEAKHDTGKTDTEKPAAAPTPAPTPKPIPKQEDIRRPELDAAVETLLAEGVNPAIMEEVVREALEKRAIPNDWTTWLRFVCRVREGQAAKREMRVDGQMTRAGSVFEQVGEMARRMMERNSGE